MVYTGVVAAAREEEGVVAASRVEDSSGEGASGQKY